MLRPGFVTRPWFQAALLVLSALGVYWVTLDSEFLRWDDTLYVFRSVRTQRPGLAGFLRLWSTEDVWNHTFFEFFPLRDSVYWGLFQLFKLRTTPYHLTSLAFHVAASLLAWRLALRVGFSRGVAFWGAWLFVVHPVHVESVAWVASLKDPMFTTFTLGALLLFQRYREQPRPDRYALCLLLLIAALLCKSVALAAPVIMLAMERLVGEKTPWRLALTRVAPAAIICALFLVQFVLVGKYAGMIVPPHGGSWSSHWVLSGWAFARYLHQAFVPATFALHYCFTTPRSLLDVRLLAALAAVALLGVIAIRARKREPLVTFLVIWFVATLLPVANLVPFPAIMADRYLYAPSLAGCLALGWILHRGPERLRPLLLMGTVALFGVVTVGRGLLWQEEPNLWAEVVSEPACRVDDNPVTASVYFTYAQQLSLGQERMAAMALGLAHPRFGALRVEHQCTYYALATRTASGLGLKELARGYSQAMLKLCPDRWQSWTLLLKLEDTHPQQAVDAARRAFRLSGNARQAWQWGIAKLTADDESGVEQVKLALELNRAETCALLARTMEQNTLEVKARLEPFALDCQALDSR
jgi:hypothetical protein